MSKEIKQFNPATGEQLPPVQSDDESTVEVAVKRAREAQEEWSKLSFKQRAKFIDNIRTYIAQNADEISNTISQSTGKLRQDALASEVLPAVMLCKWYAANTAHVLKPHKLSSGNILYSNKVSRLVYEPYGVVGIISPWNYPFTIPFGEVIMGLMAGNAIVLKVANNVTHVGKVIEKCIRASNLPPFLFQHVVLPGATIGPALLRAGVNKIFFTGSVRAGKEIMAAAAATLTPLSLELGGKDAMVVLHDANIERAVNCACWGGFSTAGQTCAAVERVYVHSSIYDNFLEQLIHKTRSLRHGPESGNFNVDMGSMTTQKQLETVQKQVKEAIDKGAQIVAQSHPVGNCNNGFFYPATVMIGCTPEMQIMKEETFGPILPVVSFETDDEAVKLANGTNLGLTSSVFSTNTHHARRVAAQLQSGVVTINDHLFTHAMSETPWGGYKESGMGRTHGVLGLKEMSNVKCITEDWLPSWLVVRSLWWYPYSETTYNTLKAAINLISPQSIMHQIKSLGFLVRHVSFMFTKWNVLTQNEVDHSNVNSTGKE